jgi:hypothetical protein
MSFIIYPLALSGNAERLARTGTGPNRSIIWPACAPKGVAPNTDAGEEVALRESVEVARVHVFDASLVNDSISDVSCRDEVSQPLSCIGVDLVVIGGHACSA